MKMGSEVPVWIEVEIVEKVWVESSGVTGDDAAEKVAARCSHVLTGRTSYERPVYPARVSDRI